MLIDTHAHLDFPEFATDLPDVLARAAEAGVSRMITVSTTVESSRRSISLATEHASVFATVGIHPSNADSFSDDEMAVLRELAGHPRVLALGECGLDYHSLPSSEMHESAVATAALGNETPADVTGAIRDGAVKAKQSEVFQRQLELAAELKLPVVVHERDAWADTVAQIKPFAGRIRAVFHCFNRSIDEAREVIDLGFLVSFTGIVTFKNARLLHETAAKIPDGSFMVETDCPFLAPMPKRGMRCEPAHTKAIAMRIAELRGKTLEEIAAETSATAERFFAFPVR
ncbi:MAG: TatD family hydrolase [Chthoniobacteraceae bacterium]